MITWSTQPLGQYSPSPPNGRSALFQQKGSAGCYLLPGGPESHPVPQQRLGATVTAAAACRRLPTACGQSCIEFVTVGDSSRGCCVQEPVCWPGGGSRGRGRGRAVKCSEQLQEKAACRALALGAAAGQLSRGDRREVFPTCGVLLATQGDEQ